MKVTINIDNRLHAALKRESEVSSQPMTSIINQAIARHLELLSFQEKIKSELQSNPERMLEIVQKVIEILPEMDKKHQSTRER